MLGYFPSGAPRSPATRVALVMEALSRAGSDLTRYEYLLGLLHRDPRTFFAAALAHTSHVMPLVYTPTVGLACQRWSHMLLPVRGLYVSLADAGRVEAMLRAWPGAAGVRAICVTDGERILGLGDLGANGMGIPVGKLALYSALAGVDPAATLPVTLDVGTNTRELLEDPCYVGVRAPREGGAAYYALVDEFVRAVTAVCGPRTLLQWEDFGNSHAFVLLEKYKRVLPSFNDDIEGTAAVVLGGLLSACAHVPGVPAFEAGTYLFFGAGEAGVGIADLIAYAVAMRAGGTVEAARKRIFLVDSKGLVTAERRGEKGFAHHKEPYAHTEGAALLARAGAAGAGGAGATPAASLSALADIVRVVKPTALIGVSTQPSTFTREVVDAMAVLNERPLIFALSNPTSKSECTAAEAYGWTGGRAMFASGSPFDPVTLPGGRVLTPGQGNNSYIFPAVGLAVVATQMTEVPTHVRFVCPRTSAPASALIAINPPPPPL